MDNETIMLNNLDNKIKLLMVKNKIRKDFLILERRDIIDNYLKMIGLYVNSCDPYGEENWDTN